MEVSEKTVSVFEEKTRKFIGQHGYGVAHLYGWLEDYDPLLRVLGNAVMADSLLEVLDKAAHLFDQCESPIEKSLLISLLIARREAGYEYLETYFAENGTGFGRACSPNDLIIEPQLEVGKYRVDFRITNREYDARVENETSVRSVYVECDGHDFHERTKEQARKDRQKDRFLQSTGIPVLRFTGSEIWADPYKCVGEIYTQLLTRGVGRKNG